MKTYLFSIFTRLYIALSGFLVFLLSSYLYGAHGRGVIAYGTAIFATFGTILSVNLGRGFISTTNKNDSQKNENLSTFLALNFIMSLITAFAGIIFWLFSNNTKGILSLNQILLFASTSFFYVWTANGNYFYSAFLKTPAQEAIIFATRTILIFLLIILILTKTHDINFFIFFYSTILFLGVAAENIHLIRLTKTSVLQFDKLKEVFKLFKNVFFHHLDYLSFFIFPLVLILVAGHYLSAYELGNINFALQFINFIFLLPVTANIRISSYVANKGFKEHLPQIKKLIIFTSLASIGLAALVYFTLYFILHKFNITQFQNASGLFLITVMAIPGYIAYQFLTPIWIELNLQKISSITNFINFIINLSFTPYLLNNYKSLGAMYSFVLFHIGIILTQAIIYYIKNNNFGFVSSR